MKIDRILLLACDRPEYLEKCLGRVLKLGIEIICVLDKPSNLERIKDYKKCADLLKKNNINFIKNKESLGCSPSMYLLLDQRHEGNNLVVEDDVILKDEFDAFIENYKECSNFILKLSNYYWGWVADSVSIDKFKAFRNQENEKVDSKFKKTTYWKAIELFQKSNTFVPFDELFDTCAEFTKIKIHSGFDMAINIGKESSRKHNKREVGAKKALFKNGVLVKLEEI